MPEEVAPTWSQAAPDRGDGLVSEAAPARSQPAEGWEHFELYKAVEAALYAVPAYFKSELNVVDVEATDLFQFNSPLAGAIETQTVRALNGLRELWDPDSEYPDYTFIRQAQRFPDVVLRTDNPDAEEPILMGIELKGWYALAKEGEPSYRMHVNPDACAPADLLAVFPWVFENVVSGGPRLLRPFVREARFAAEMKNWYWQHGRRKQANEAEGYRSIVYAENAPPYPAKADPVDDSAVHDSGNNFGRVSRTGIMDDFLDELMAEPLAGIPLKEWRAFFTQFTGE
jgi:hypothetical protein